SDPQGRPTIMPLLPSEPRVFAVGRLDMDTSGLLLVTNDGDFAQKVSHPRFGVPKTYLAEVSGHAGSGHVTKLRAGVELEDGRASAERVRLSGIKRGHSLVELTVREGRNRLVRRLLEAVGLPVVSLVRTSIGPCRLGRLKAGTYRTLSAAEVHELLSSASASVD
ncbi:MAG TPA: pseudouridine synthase, partial [Actinomycetota bacterium]|nr:pseudouridine synthase [Actinomycetota bacterium]